MRHHLGCFGTAEPAFLPATSPNTVSLPRNLERVASRRLSTSKKPTPSDVEVKCQDTETIVLLPLSTAVRCILPTFEHMKAPIATDSRDMPDIAGLGKEKRVERSRASRSARVLAEDAKTPPCCCRRETVGILRGCVHRSKLCAFFALSALLLRAASAPRRSH